MSGDASGLGWFENAEADAVDGEVVLLLAIHKARVTEHAEMVRDRDDFRFQTVGQLAHVQRAGSQSVDREHQRTQPIRVHRAGAGGMLVSGDALID